MPAATSPTLRIPKEQGVNTMDIYALGYQQYELAKQLAASRQRRRESAGGDWTDERDNDMDHQNFLFYLHRTRQDTRRKMRYESEDPLWSVPEHGHRWGGRALAALRRPIPAALTGIGHLRLRLRGVRRAPTTSE